MREMGPSFVTVAAQGFYRSRVRNCYPLPSEYPPGYSDFFISKIILKKLYRNMQLFACFPLYYEK